MKRPAHVQHRAVVGRDWDESPRLESAMWEPPASRKFTTLGFRVVFTRGNGVIRHSRGGDPGDPPHLASWNFTDEGPTPEKRHAVGFRLALGRDDE